MMLRCNKRIALNPDATRETYCRKDKNVVNSETGERYHEGPCSPEEASERREEDAPDRGKVA
jgi:hypothetical protein